MKINLKQFIKFLIAGANNTSIDFLILNILMIVSNIYSGSLVILFNCISFSIAVTNSYLVNRFWAFNQVEVKKIRNVQFFLIPIILLILLNLKFLKNNIFLIFLIILFFAIVIFVDSYIVKNYLNKNELSKSSTEFGKFVFLTLIGMIINSGILYILTSFVNPFFGLSVVLWANFSKAIATIISLFWNFFSYRTFIFKRSSNP